MSSPFAMSNVEKVCRNVCQLMRFLIPARTAAGRIIFAKTKLGEKGNRPF